MTTAERYDLTSDSEFRFLEVLTRAGTVRINVGLADTQTRAPVVVVEVEPRDASHQQRTGEGTWKAEARPAFSDTRIDVRLTRQN